MRQKIQPARDPVRDIPAVGRLERHFVGRAIETRDDHVIDAPVGLEHANLIG